MKREWIIWSIEHNAWWKPRRNGYVIERVNAGRYTYDEAVKIVESGNINKNNTPNEAMIKLYE